MKKSRLVMVIYFGLLTLSGFFIWGCGPKALFFKGGEDLNKMITERKLTVAVLPAIDWSEDEGCCAGYMLYGCAGAVSRSKAYSDGGLTVTNELTKAFWKKNRMKIVNKNILISNAKQAKLTPEEIFPKHETMFCGLYNKPVTDINEVGQGQPNYNKIYALGKNVGADIIFIVRLTKNTQTPYCGGQNPLGAFPPFTTAIAAADYIYKAGIRKYKYNYIAIDIMALDVNNKTVVGFGGYNKYILTPEAEKAANMEKYTAAITFYAPLPDREDLEKEFLANAASIGANMIANAIISQSGLNLTITFNFNYEYGDETWKMYPQGTFENNYGLTNEEYTSLLK